MEELYTKIRQWRDRWILGGDFNDIRGPEDKRGGRIRSVASCKRFRELIGKMNIEEIAYQRKEWTGQIIGMRRVSLRLGWTDSLVHPSS